MPALIASIYYFGLQSLRVFSLSIAFSVIFDFVADLIVPTKDSPENWSSVLMAILLGAMLPINSAWWVIVVGCFIMIIIGKKLFGGLGAYPVHPVLLSYAMLSVSWPSRFDYTASLVNMSWNNSIIEVTRLIKTLGSSAQDIFSINNLLLGKQAAGAASGMVLFLLLGGVFLAVSRQIRWYIPLSFLAGTFITAFIFHSLNPAQFATPFFQLISGGTVFAAFYLATDYTTSPINVLPMIVYGLLGGLLLVLIRSFSMHTDGIVYTILLINLTSPLLDRIAPKVYGFKGI